MLEQLLAIVRNTFVESIRQPIYLVMVGVGIVALVINPGLSTFTLKDDNAFLIDMGLATIFLAGLLIAAFIATSVLTREIENKTVLTVVSKPVGRPVFVFGKYLGVTASLFVATTILAAAFLLTKRHGALQTARDEIDYPVVVFGTIALLLSVGIGVWCNYFYGWVFTSTTVVALWFLSLAAWFGTVLVDKEWNVQLFVVHTDDHGDVVAAGLSPDLDFQMLLALAGVFMALAIIASVAIAASTRLGQVMTVFTCILVFMLGLLSDTLFGKRAFEAEPLARIVSVERIRDLDDDFSDDEDRYSIRVDRGVDLADEMPVYVSSDNLGFGLLGGPAAGQAAPATLRNLARVTGELVKVGDSPMSRPPRVDDYLIDGPPTVHPGWRFVWSIPPNLQFLFLVDALTQRHEIPMSHMRMLAGYTVLYVGAMLSLAVILFQTREVG